MASKWRQLAPHFLAMFILYGLCVILAAVLFDIQSFWTSLVIALAIALVYPSLTRRLGVEPEPWRRD